jgi:hypothetical protein
MFCFVGPRKKISNWEPKHFENLKIIARKKAYQNRSNLNGKLNKKESYHEYKYRRR